MDKAEVLKNNFPRIKTEAPLGGFSTFKIGGTAKYLLETSDPKELRRAVEYCLSHGTAFHVLGGGSNTLIGDGYFDGLLIVYGGGSQDLEISASQTDGFFEIKADASIPLSLLVRKLDRFSGLEWAVGIPGTLGGAVNGNAGAFGVSMADSIVSVEAIDSSNPVSPAMKIFKKDDCQFAYRTSIFKRDNSLIIVSAVLRLQEGNKEEIFDKMKTYLNERAIKHPKGLSAGSVFKNYRGKVQEDIISRYPELKKFEEKGVIPAGFLIESCGLKGRSQGDAKISDDHANFIINLGKATAADVIALINLAKKEVSEKFKINLEEEIQFFNC